MKSVFLFAALMSAGISAARADCNASATAGWNAGQVQAVAIGETCGNALVVLIVRNKGGGVAWSWSAAAQNNLAFAEATTKAKMQQALQVWASGKGFFKSADKLLTDSEFPFEPSAALQEGEFKALQRAKAPIFCFIAGMESGRCLGRLQSGEIIEIGVQRFPG